MRVRRGSEPSGQALAAYVDGEVTPFEAEAIEAALADSAAVRRRVAGLRRVRDALSGPVPKLESVDLVASVRKQVERPTPAARAPSQVWACAAVACVAAAAAVALVRHAEPATSGQLASEFRAKSAHGGGSEQARWAGIRAYWVAGGAPPEPLSERPMPRAAGLLFSYTNIGPRPFAFLMIFAVDARGEVRWCYPGYERQGTDPAALRIDRGAEIPLGDLIQLDLAPGRATVHALFSPGPLHVLEVEGWLRESRTGSAPPWPEVAHRELPIEVAP